MRQVGAPRACGPLNSTLSYCLQLLINFDIFEVDHGGRLAAMGGVGPQVVVEGDPASDARFCLRSGFPGVQIEIFILQRPPETFNEDVVEVSGFAIHRDLGLGPLQPVGLVVALPLNPRRGVQDATPCS